jgi:hypothetical protein
VLTIDPPPRLPAELGLPKEPHANEAMDPEERHVVIEHQTSLELSHPKAAVDGTMAP